MSQKRYSYRTEDTCCTRIDIELHDNTVVHVEFHGGCHGNLQGIAKLVEGMPVASVVERLNGINCKTKGTSCPDQLSKALIALQGEEMVG